MTYPTNEPGPNPTTPAPAEPEPEKPVAPDDDRWRKALREIASGNAAVAFF